MTSTYCCSWLVPPGPSKGAARCGAAEDEPSSGKVAAAEAYLLKVTGLAYPKVAGPVTLRLRGMLTLRWRGLLTIRLQGLRLWAQAEAEAEREGKVLMVRARAREGKGE